MSERQCDWEEVTLGDIAEVINGRAYKLSEWETSGTPVIRLQNLTQRGGDFYFSNLALPEKQYCQKGDLLYMWSATFGPHIWWGEKAIFHYHIWKIEPNERIDKKFLFYLLDAKTQEWRAAGSGMAMIHLTKAGIEKELLAVPPLPEQKKIAEILSGIDVTIRATESKLQKLITIRSNASEDLLAKTNAEATKMPLGDCIELVRGYAFKSEEYREKGGTRILRVTNITEQGKIDLANNCVHISEDLTDHYNRFQVRENDLLLVMVGATTGKLGVVSKADVPSLLNQNIWCLRTSSPSEIIQEYLHYSMPKVVSRHLEKQQGSARDFLTQKEFFKEEIEIPNLAIQRKIVQVMGQIDKCIDATRGFRERLLFLKSALSADLLSGHKRVTI